MTRAADLPVPAVQNQKTDASQVRFVLKKSGWFAAVLGEDLLKRGEVVVIAQYRMERYGEGLE